MGVKSHELPLAPSNESRVDELVRRVFDSNLGPETLTPKERLELLKESFGLPDHKRKLVVERLCAHYEIPTNDVKIVPAIELNAVLLLEYFGIDVSDVKKEYGEINWEDIKNALGLSRLYPPGFAEFVQGCIGVAIKTHAWAIVNTMLERVKEIQSMEFSQLNTTTGRDDLSRFGMVDRIYWEVLQAIQSIDGRIYCPIVFVKWNDYLSRDKVEQIFGTFQITQQLISNTAITKSPASIVSELEKQSISLEGLLEPITRQE